MVANILDGAKIAKEIKNDLKTQINLLVKKKQRIPGLAVILASDDEASALYVNKKQKACKNVGFLSWLHKLPKNTDEKTLLDLIDKLNNSKEVDGILVQLPLAKHIDPQKITEKISPKKDVDGFHPYNVGRLAQRYPALRACTPFGIITLIKSTNTNLFGLKAVIVGASNIVGRPMMLELLLAGCTVTICHRFTKNIASEVASADLLIVAVGRVEFIKGSWIKKGAIVIDVGIQRDLHGNLKGDVEFDVAKHNASWITPVPGGVGPMTVASLMQNTMKSYLMRQNNHF